MAQPQSARTLFGTPESPAVVRDRFLFLDALQHDCPEFFYEFRNGCRDIGGESWCQRRGITDEWLLKVLRDSHQDWCDFPHTSRAQFDHGWPWYTYRPAGIKPLTVTLTDPYPLHHPGWVESESEFVDRMRQQFEQQLAEHKTYLKHVSFSSDNRSQRRHHAEWTALIFGGRATVAEIAEKWPGMEDYKDHESTIRNGVKRFAEGIDLALKWTRS